MNKSKSERKGGDIAAKSGSPRFGRPPRHPSEVRCNRVVTFITDSQLAELKRIARRDGTSLSKACFHILEANIHKSASPKAKI